VSHDALLITGASGFVGRHLIRSLQDHVRIFAVGRRTPSQVGIEPHPHVTWFQADICEPPQIAACFSQVAALGGARTVIHLAAHYDFTGEESDTYWRTNVEGLRHVLALSAGIGVEHVLFSSSVAACPFPDEGASVTERTPPLGDHIYARTKRAGEELLAEYDGRLHCVILRFAALFSDWCEYPPLYMFLQTWLGSGWNRRILGGRGRSAIPYLHVDDVVLFIEATLARLDELRQREVLVASPDGAVSHRQLFEAATLAYFGARSEPVLLPRALCGPGMHARDLVGRLTGNRPFERPWMAEYIDKELRIDASHSRLRLDWSPRPRLAILRRMPFLIDHLKTQPTEWNRRNREAMKVVSLPLNLKVHWLLQAHEAEIVHEFNELLTGGPGHERFASYRDFTPEEHAWHHTLVLRHLMNAVRTTDPGIFIAYCRDLARQRLSQGFHANELCGALEGLNLVCYRVLRRDPASADLWRGIVDYVTGTLRAGCDAAQEVFELDEAHRRVGRRRQRHGTPATVDPE
jgi:nucleoside-diphosphate-sugar epimerase